jgi:hypothetical protein
MKLNIEQFEGTVVLKQSTWWMDGRSYAGFRGTVSVLEGKEALGFEVKDESNWFARIEGKTASVNIPGCQVKMVVQGGQEPVEGSMMMVVP